MTVRLRRLLAAPLLAGLLAVLGAAPATAHASLRATTPADGAVVEDPPREVTLTFDESVDVPTAGVRVFDGTGTRVDDGSVTHPAPDTIGVRLPQQLDDGTYVVTWRAVSSDGHPIRGAFLFSVGTDAGVGDDLVADLFAGGGESITSAVAAATRSAAYLGALLAAGAAVFAVAVARGRDSEVVRRWLGRGLVLTAAATALVVPVQAMLETGFGPIDALAPAVLGDTLLGSVGQAALVRLVGLAVLALSATRIATRGPGAGWAAAAGATLTLGSFLVDGHTRTVAPAWLLWTADATHLVAAATWLGGLVLLAALVRRDRAADDPLAAADIIARFSGVAGWSLAGVTAAGVAMSWALVRVPRALTSTAYGWTLLVKVAIVVVVVLVGAYNRRQLVPRIARAAEVDGVAVPAGGSSDASGPATTAAWRTLGRTSRLEIGLLVAVLLVTGALVNLRPAAEAAGVTGAYQTRTAFGDQLTLELVVDPNRAGDNEIHLYLLDATGRPATDLEDVRLAFAHPATDVGPIERVPDVAGPGHWVLTGRALPIPGDWIITVTAATGRFDEASAEIPVTVNPA